LEINKSVDIFALAFLKKLVVSIDTLSRKVEGLGPEKPWQPPSVDGKVLIPIRKLTEKISRE